MPDLPVSALLTTLGLSMGVQAVFFVFAASLKTDKVTDLSYGLTFVALAGLVLVNPDSRAPAQLALAGMVILWGVRLATYLLYRIIRIKRDPRFDGVREHFWTFFRFWFFQGVAVWVIMLPVILWFERPGPWSAGKTIGLSIWFAGLVIETIADIQKFVLKSRGGSRWMDTGLWRYSRHPNYFGEMLCWWGVFVFAAGDLGGWIWLAVIGPLGITYLLLFVTGIPTLEKSAERKWGRDPAYRDYRRRTSRLVPWFPRRR